MNFKIDDPNCTSEYDGDIEIPELGKWYSWEEVMILRTFNVVLAGFGFVYLYYDTVNKMYYVGVCKQSVRARAQQHYARTGHLPPIDSAIKDIGCNRFLVCVVKVCKIEDLEYFENYFIDSLNTLQPNGYNAMKSGYKNIRGEIQKMLERELPKERLLKLLETGYTYVKITETLLPIKISPTTLSDYGVSLGIILRDRFSPKEVAELASKGYSNKKIADTLGAKNASTIQGIRRRHNIPSGGKKYVRRPMLKIDPSSGIIITRYLSVSEAATKNGLQCGSLVNKLKATNVVNGAYLVYEDEYLKQQRSVTQAVEGA